MNNFFIEQANFYKQSDSGRVPNKTVNTASSTSFSEHVKQKMAMEKRRNQLRTQEEHARKIAEQKRLEEKKQSMALKNKEADASALAAKLEVFMQRLKEMAEDYKNGPGQWSMTITDDELLKDLGSNAGMTPAEINNLLEKWRLQGGQLAVVDLFDSMSRHFNEMVKSQLITSDETDLPLLETLLARMGVTTEQIKQVSDNAVTGDGRFDLVKFLEGLEEIRGAGSTALSDWEAEQLQQVLEKAGASEKLQSSLLWERGNTQWNSAPVVLGIGRMKQMIAEAINEINNNRLRPNLQQFLTEFDKLIAQTTFEDKTVGWSPVVQNSLLAAYRELLSSVDLSTVDMKMANRMPTWEMHWQNVIDDPAIEQTGSKFSLPRISAIMQQQIMEQVSRAMLRTLQRNEHHLLLKLQPPELGEVKIDLLVRGEKVTVSFGMENRQVKELLEGNMSQFQQSLAEKGFELGEFTVTVNQQENNEGRDFAGMWKEMQSFKDQEQSDVEHVVQKMWEDRQIMHNGQLSLFV